jgi:glycosyltransferase involved in cell wall biosynthesis
VSSSRLRVLAIIKGLGPGGAERLLVGQAEAHDRQELDLEVAHLLPDRTHLVPDIEHLGVPVTCLDGSPEWDLRWLLRLRRRLVRRPVDVVHTHSPYVAIGVRLVVRTLPRRSRPALVHTEHNLWPHYALPTRLLNRATYGLDDAHIAVSAEVRRTVSPRHRASVEVVVHGVDLDAVRAKGSDRAGVRRELGAGDDEVLVGTVANLRPSKALHHLIDAAATVLAADVPARFVVVGRGPLEEALTAQIGAMGLGDRFRLLGYRADAVRLLGGFDVFALSSLYEGLPVAVMEALALGVPVVATDVGGLPEAVTDGVDGRLVGPATPDRLAEALLELIQDPQRRAAMATAARVRGDAFAVERSVRRMEAIYRTVRAGMAEGD